MTALLAGVVALNVAVLRLNLQLEQLGDERIRLRAENAELRLRSADALTPSSIRAGLRAEGYHQVDPAAVRFIALDRRAR